jgi:hypothetical protein
LGGRKKTECFRLADPYRWIINTFLPAREHEYVAWCQREANDDWTLGMGY